MSLWLPRNFGTTPKGAESGPQYALLGWGRPSYLGSCDSQKPDRNLVAEAPRLRAGRPQ